MKFNVTKALMMLPIVGAVERKRQERVEERVAKRRAEYASVMERRNDEIFPDRPKAPPPAAGQ